MNVVSFPGHKALAAGMVGYMGQTVFCKFPLGHLSWRNKRLGNCIIYIGRSSSNNRIAHDHITLANNVIYGI